MYQFIIEPNSGKPLTINSLKAKKLLIKYCKNILNGGMERGADEFGFNYSDWGEGLPPADPKYHKKQKKAGLSTCFNIKTRNQNYIVVLFSFNISCIPFEKKLL